MGMGLEASAAHLRQKAIEDPPPSPALLCGCLVIGSFQLIIELFS